MSSKFGIIKKVKCNNMGHWHLFVKCLSRFVHNFKSIRCLFYSSYEQNTRRWQCQVWLCAVLTSLLDLQAYTLGPKICLNLCWDIHFNRPMLSSLSILLLDIKWIKTLKRIKCIVLLNKPNGVNPWYTIAKLEYLIVIFCTCISGQEFKECVVCGWSRMIQFCQVL